MRRHLTPAQVTPPFGRYHQAVALDAPRRLLVISGQLGIRADGTIPESVEEQTALILGAIEACLVEAELTRADLLRLTTYLTEAEYRLPYMRVRDAWVADPPPASTLVVVKALVLPAAKIEIEAIAGA
jgi:enamine deaminase RidA (YjgF/YER057c/UK114 family)